MYANCDQSLPPRSNNFEALKGGMNMGDVVTTPEVEPLASEPKPTKPKSEKVPGKTVVKTATDKAKALLGTVSKNLLEAQSWPAKLRDANTPTNMAAATCTDMAHCAKELQVSHEALSAAVAEKVQIHNFKGLQFRCELISYK